MRGERSGFLLFLGKRKGMAFGTFLLAGIYVVTLLLTPFFMGKAIDQSLGRIFEYGSPLWEESLRLFWIDVALMGALSSASAISEFFFEYLANALSQRVVKDVRDSLFEKMTYLPLSYVDNRPHGDLLSLASVDAENLMTGVTGAFKQLLEGVFTLAFTLAFMFSLNWILASAVLILTPLSFLVSTAVERGTRRHFQAQAKTAGSLAGFALERIQNHETVRAFGIEEASQEEFERLDQALFEEGRRAQFLSSWTNPSTRLVNNVVYAVIGFAGILLVSFSSQAMGGGDGYVALSELRALLSIGAFTTFLTYALKFAKPFNDISSVASEIQNAKASYRRIQALLEERDERDGEQGASFDLPSGDLPTIRFQDVVFGYEKDRPILKGIDLEVYAGHKVALVGPTGCGKTTLVNLLLRFYDPDSGRILLGGVDARSLPKGRVRKLFGMVLQDTWIFRGTVRENIAYAKPDASLAEVQKAAQRAQASSFIERLPDKYDTVISSSSGLSEGEKQLLSIARVLLLDPRMIILDEATSSLDAVSERNITAAIAELSKDRTSIVIAHRLQTIVRADAIVVVVDGRIGELGTHEQLMEKKGFYYELYASQYQ